MLTWKVVVFFPSPSISAELYEGVSCLFFKCQPESDARDELINSLILRNDWITIQLLINSLFFTAPAHPDAVLHVYPPSCCIYLSLISWCYCAAAAVQRINEMQFAQPPPSRRRVVDSTLILNARLISQVPPASCAIGAKQQLAYLVSFVWMTGRLIKRKTRPAQHSSPAEMLAKRKYIHPAASKNLLYYSAVNCSMCKVAVHHHQQPADRNALVHAGD